MTESEFVDWETDEWPKDCVCGYEATDDTDAIIHAVDEHRELVVKDE